MLRIEPAIQIHTSRTGASSFSASFRGCAKGARDWPIPEPAHLSRFSRVRRASSRRRRHETRPPLYPPAHRSEEQTSELQSLMRISYAVFCLKKNKINRMK